IGFLSGRKALRYALAPFAVAIAFLARLALTPILGDASPYPLFVPAVLVAGGLAGCGKTEQGSRSDSDPFTWGFGYVHSQNEFFRSRLGGLGPGLLATGLSAALGFFVITVSPGVSASEIVDAALFTMIGAGIAWSGEQLQRNRIRAATSMRDALAREAHLAS